MAPEAVLRYLVTHEAVHLAVPDHSQEFWLTVRSLCPKQNGPNNGFLPMAIIY